MKKSLAWLGVWFGGVAASSAMAAPAVTLWGEPKYKAGFQQFDYVNAHAPQGGTIRLSTMGAFDSLNPFILKGVSAPGVSGLVYQTLMVPSFDEPSSYYPLIASDFTLSKDRASAEVTLNPAARWQDGTPITPEDVVWSLKMLKTKGHPSYQVELKPITAEVTGPHALRFRFADTKHRELAVIAASLPVLPKHGFCEGEAGGQRPEASKGTDSRASNSPLEEESTRHFGASVGGGDAVSSPPTKTQEGFGSPSRGELGALESSANSLASGPRPLASPCFDKTSLTPPLGSGPYRVSAVEAGRSITFSRVKDYWAANLPSQRGFYHFDTVRYDVYRDDTVALEGLKSHQFDFYEEFIARNWATAYDIPAVKSGELVKTLIPHQIPRGMQGFIFNTRLPKFADARVREAIGLTLDFEWMNKTLFYGAYQRGRSYFNHTEFEAGGEIGEGERKVLEGVISHQSPVTSKGEDSSVPLMAGDWRLETDYTVPTTDGSGYARENLIKAQGLLEAAGWVMRDGKRVNAKTGEPLTVEFLMTQRTFERVIAIMRYNLKKLGIASTFRYIDASQYQKRVEKKQFEMVSVWWNQGLFYPSTEQYLYWHSSQADVEGSQNLGGVKNPLVDALVERIQNAQTLEDLRPAARLLDRVLTHEYYIIPHWNLNAWRVAYWNQFGRPKVTPAYNLAPVETWWEKGESRGQRSEVRGQRSEFRIQNSGRRFQSASSPLEGEPNRFFSDLVGGNQHRLLSPHQNREGRFWLPLKGGAGALESVSHSLTSDLWPLVSLFQPLTSTGGRA